MDPARAKELIDQYTQLRKQAFALVLPQVSEAFDHARQSYPVKTAAAYSWPAALRLHLETP